MSFREFHAAVDGYMEAHGQKREDPIRPEQFGDLARFDRRSAER